jgi:hypothetical protein
LFTDFLQLLSRQVNPGRHNSGMKHVQSALTGHALVFNHVVQA